MKLYLDVGSTIVKTSLKGEASLNPLNIFFDRDYNKIISDQVQEIISELQAKHDIKDICICSSANGGIKVGVISRSIKFSGSIAKNLCSSAGANIVYGNSFAHLQNKKNQHVDILIVAGGVDGYDLPKLKDELRKIDFSDYSFDSLIYCGNSKYFDIITEKFPAALFVENPMDDSLKIRNEELLNKIRSAYLDNLIDKKGIKKIVSLSSVPVWPTPAVVNLAYSNILSNRSDYCYAFPLVVIDIGGATTDIHYGSELCFDVTQVKPFRSTNRHVFTDVGVFTSKESTFNRLRYNDLLPDFLSVVSGNQATDKLMEILDGGRDHSLLFAACFFLAFYRLTHNSQEDETPELNLQKAGAVLITGGASQCLDAKLAGNLLNLLLPNKYKDKIPIYLDDDYHLWSHGLSLIEPNYARLSEKI